MKPDASAPPAGTAPAPRPERFRSAQAKKLMLEMLRKYPIVEAACAKAGISRSTHYEWMKTSDSYREGVEEAMRASTDTVTDIAESNIIEGVKRGDYKCTAFWLTHRHPTYKKGADPEDSKFEKLLIKPPPSDAFVKSIRKYDPTYNPPTKPEYITREAWEREQQSAEKFSRMLKERFGPDFGSKSKKGKS